MTELREAQNNVEIIGTVTKIELEEKVSKKGKEMINGSVTVEVKTDNKVNAIKVKILSMRLNKKGEVSGLFKGYKTVKDEWQKGDRCKVVGSIGIQQYYGKGGDLVQFNEVKGLFLNRLEGEEANKPDKAIATVEMVVENMVSELDKDNIPTGRLNVEAFTIGYNSSVTELKNMKIAENLSKVFQDMYFPGSTGKITFKINNYVEVEKVENEVEMAGFGAAERVEDNVVTNYESSFEIIGGDLPYIDGVNNYSPDEIEQAHRNLKLALQTLKANSSASETPQASSGFGNTAANDLADKFTGGQTETPYNSDDDVPAF